MSEPRLAIGFDGGRETFRPHEILSGHYHIAGAEAPQIAALEVSVLWYTEGKGEEDLAVHFFKRLDVDAGDYVDPRQPGRFSTLLPQSPLSYEGVIVKIRWCARVRLFLRNGRELVEERRFRLGDVPPARAVLR